MAQSTPALAQVKKFRLYERYMIRRFHPRRIMIDAAALPWVVYLIWNHDWISAAIVWAVSFTLGLMATEMVDPGRFSSTALGRMALLHLRAWNIALQSVGLLGMLFSLWNHSTMGILGSLSIIFLGHLFGWDDVLVESGERVRKLEAA